MIYTADFFTSCPNTVHHFAVSSCPVSLAADYIVVSTAVAIDHRSAQKTIYVMLLLHGSNELEPSTWAKKFEPQHSIWQTLAFNVLKYLPDYLQG